MPDAITAKTIAYLTEGGGYRIPADSGMGNLYRPFAGAQDGSRVSTLETLYEFWINDVPDPDEALRLDPNIRMKLRMHPDVAAAMRKRELTVASFPDRIEPNPDATDSHVAKQVSDYVGWVWRQIPKRQLLYQQMQGAVMDGGRGHEWMWHREANGIERPVQFSAVDKSRFIFDRLGNLALRTRTEPVWGSYVMANPQSQVRNDFPRGKFTYHMHRQEPGPWDDPQLEGYMYFGCGEDVALYYVTTFDIFVLRMRVKWLEMFGFPPTDIYYPHNMPEFIGKLKTLVSQVGHETIATIPRLTGPTEGEIDSLFKVQYRNVPTMSYDAFQTFSDKYTKPRVDSILLGSAEEGQKSEQGAYSEHIARQDSGPQIWFKWDARNIASTIQAQLIPPIVWGRFPNLPIEYMPIFKLEAKEERDRRQEGEILELGTKLVPVAEEEVYDKLGLRKPKEGEKTVTNPGSQGMDPFDQDIPGMPGLARMPQNPDEAKAMALEAAKQKAKPSGFGQPPEKRSGNGEKTAGIPQMSTPIGSGRGRTAAGNGIGYGRY